MAWKFHNEAPIYLQIVDMIKLQIAQGILKPGEQIPSVRELAVTAGVNPNTMQKALAELERDGILYSQRTAGRFVADSVMNIENMRDELSKKYVQQYVNSMQQLGYSHAEMTEVLSRYILGGRL